jgi:hypothetical protein
MLSHQVAERARKIGEFYLQKNNNDYAATAKELTDLQIIKLDVVFEYTVITTARPGKLIGRKGKNIDDLTAFLGGKIKIIEDMDCLLDTMIPVKFDEYDYDNYEEPGSIPDPEPTKQPYYPED